VTARIAAAALAAAVLAGPVAAQSPSPASPPPVRLYPHLATEVDLGLYSVSTVSAPDRARRGTSLYLFGEIAAGLHLAPGFSLQGVLSFEPIGEGDSTGSFPGDGVTLFRRQSAFLEALFAEWKPAEGATLYAGRFVAPFARGHHDFPGILPRVRAHEVSLISDSLGFGGTLQVLGHPTYGTHDVSAAAFTLDRTFLSSTLLTRRRCCDERYERFSRNTAAQGGPANTGQLDSFAVALDGDGIAALPGFSYHLGLVSRGAGRDGTAREWGYAAALRYEHRWSAEQATLFFAEGIQFRNAGGRPRAELTSTVFDPDLGADLEVTEEVAVSERRTFTTLGLRHRVGEWRGTLAWQRDERRRRVERVPTENYIEASVGRELGRGFGLDVGYQYGRYAREETGGLGTSHAVLVRLGWTAH
jgi:hypothetical protein